jgi:hypothetical protein
MFRVATVMASRVAAVVMAAVVAFVAGTVGRWNLAVVASRMGTMASTVSTGLRVSTASTVLTVFRRT